MNFFTKSVVTIESPQQSETERLARVQRAFENAELEFDEASRQLLSYNRKNPDPRTARPGGVLFCRTGAMTFDKKRQALEATHSRAQEVRNRLLGERAELLRHLGLIR